MYNVGETIATLRKEAGLTQENLANMLGVSSQAVSKWETGTTMPDIMLLPLIADVFDTDIDTLFGRRVRSMNKKLTKDNIHEEMYNSFFEIMQHFWCQYEGKDAVDVRDDAKKAREAIKKYTNSQTMVLSNIEGNGVFADCDIALTFNKEKNEIAKLFDDDSAWKVLKRFADGDTRKIFKFIVENREKSFTSSFIATKCEVELTSAERALRHLLEMNLLGRKDVDTGDGTIYVYFAWGLHKLLLFYAMLTLASRLGNYVEHYRGGFMS
ncbi:MAG: helix-turn-helix transcriptional regulator [Clostridia bacterium]|nr:helix-turn-helix transcriptional regulator [Clostridia bacterium]